VSTLKHTIRHQQAQLQTLENVLLRGPRPYPPEISDPGMSSPPLNGVQSSPSKMNRRSSYDVLHGMAPDSNLPLPRREPVALEDFREGVPMTFTNGTNPAPPSSYKRGSSPTRTLSRTSSSFVLPYCADTALQASPCRP
jgi:hypothetical protein